MKNKKGVVITLVMVVLSGAGLVAALSFTSVPAMTHKECCKVPETKVEGCVFKTFFGEEDADSAFIYKTPQRVSATMQDGLEWIMQAQLNNGGWGAGSHSQQNINDPHAVKADPATTAMVAMGILRCENKIVNGKYSTQLHKALLYLLREVESSDEEALNITSLQGTQPQVKLGQNIDVVLTSQFLTNISDYIKDAQLKSRVNKSNQKCVSKIQRAQNANGSQSGSGWAGVLQSSFATNALETAKDKGIAVDEDALERSISYQKNNVDAESQSVKTEEAAGVLLYSVSSSSRASAKEARIAKERIAEARKQGKVAANAPVTVNNLKAAGMNESDAMKYSSAYKINEVAKRQAQREDVMSGFGSNGGEEFLSYLQTGEGLIMNKDVEWKKWYDNISGRLIKIQNNDGSWSGHHCITSPVFCTATSLLILSVNNDVERLIAMGGR